MSERMTQRRSLAFPVAAMLVAVALWLRWSAVHRWLWVDTDVYVRGASAILRHESLYGVRVHDLPFTYSPFAALLFIPLQLLGTSTGRWVLTGLSLLSYLVIVVVCARSVRLGWQSTALVAAAGLATEPFARNTLLGQINLLLILLVVVDCLLVTRLPRGVLVGVAAGIKIVPGVFVLYFALKREWAAVWGCLLGFAGTVVCGALVAPADSLRFWGGGFASLGKFGPAAVMGGDNQSLQALLMRVMHDPAPSRLLTLGVSAVGLGLGLWAAHRQLRSGQELAAVVCVAIGSLLASPISWTHHWLWVVPALIVLAGRRSWVLTWTVGLVFTVGPMWLVHPGQLRELHHSWWQVALCGSYVALGVVLLVANLRADDRGTENLRPHDPRGSDEAPVGVACTVPA